MYFTLSTTEIDAYIFQLQEAQTIPSHMFNDLFNGFPATYDSTYGTKQPHARTSKKT